MKDSYFRPKAKKFSHKSVSAKGGKVRKGKNGSSLDPRLLVKAALPLEEAVYLSERTFSQMPINARLKATLGVKGYTHPTEIQDRTLESLLQGHNLLGVAQTGTGKTGAFLIPIIHRLLEERRFFQTLVIVPTRELAQQVDQEFKSMSKGLALFSVCFIGGTNVNRDMQQLRKPSHFVIGTPGRLLDLVNRRALNLRDFQVLVIDEFDRMLDMGFAPDVKQLTFAMTGRKQTLLFSATMDRTQQPIIDKILHQPKEVRVSSGEVAADHIEQDVIHVEEANKFSKLVEILGRGDFYKVLLFSETRRGVKQLWKKLQQAGFTTDQIHGDISQNARQRALDRFKAGKIQVLVATDVAARGLDISDVTHVINYQMPKTYMAYIHRIGRTGRAGKGGKAFTFVH